MVREICLSGAQIKNSYFLLDGALLELHAQKKSLGFTTGLNSHHFLKLDFACGESCSLSSFPTLPSKQSDFAENNAETDSVAEPNRVSETVRKVSVKRLRGKFSMRL